jgi:tRNA-specific 2-thiouridylase
MNIALQLGADFVATGHYCRKGILTDADGNETYQLLAGKDSNKDQSYFLCQLSQEQLAKTLFPIGELTKPEVRSIAARMNLVTADKKDSQGLCFIGKVRLPEFLQQQLKPKTGKIVQVPATIPVYERELPSFANKTEELAFRAEKAEYNVGDGHVVGEHQGAHYFTKGQRKGLNVGGTKEPLFVIDTDVQHNIIYTGEGKSHPGLYRHTLFVTDEELHWVRPDLSLDLGEEVPVLARIRYRQELQKATLYKVVGGMYLDFEEAQSAIQEGQFAAWYLEDELIGSGVIS